MTVGEKIRFYRNSKNLRIKHITSTSQGYLSQIENNHVSPSVDTILKIAKDMQIPGYWLLLGVDRKHNGELI